MENISLASNITKIPKPNEPMTPLFFPALVLCVLGIPGTLVTIRFYGKQSLKSSGATSTLLTALAVFDMLSLISSIPYICLAVRMLFVDKKQGKLDFFCHYYVPNYVVRFPKYCANVMLMIIATERLFSVIKPHDVKKVFSRKVGLICIIAIAVVIPILLLPLAFEYKCVEIYDENTDFHQFSEIGKVRPLFKSIYMINVIFFYSLPLGTVFICNVGLIASLIRRSYSSSHDGLMTSMQAREMKTTKLVLVVTCIFILCVSPLGIFYPLRGVGDTSIPQPVYRAIMPIATFLESINYSMNALVYFIGSARFRAETRQILCRLLCCKTHKVSPVQDSNQTTNSVINNY